MIVLASVEAITITFQIVPWVARVSSPQGSKVGKTAAARLRRVRGPDSCM